MGHPPQGKRPEDLAAAWFVKLRGPLGEADRHAFDEWRDDPENARAYDHVEQTWDRSLFLANTPAGRDRDLTRVRRPRWPGLALAAGLTGLVLGSGYWTLIHPGGTGPEVVSERTQSRDYAAGRSSVQVVKLADGSRVTLDRGAAIRDLSSTRERRLVLLRGRARFDVVPDPARAFTVDAGAGRVIAHGTVFDVSLEGPSVRVVLLRGSVEVAGLGPARAKSSRFLSPGEQLLVKEGAIERPTAAEGAALAWASDMISFDGVPLPEAVQAFNRGGGQQIELVMRDPTPPRLSGAFRRDDPDGFAKALAISFGLEAGQGPGGAIILRDATAEAAVK